MGKSHYSLGALGLGVLGVTNIGVLAHGSAGSVEVRPPFVASGVNGRGL